MGKTLIRRLAAIVLLSILPAALLMAIAAAHGSIGFGTLAIAIGLGLAGGAVMSALVARLLLERAQVLEQAARALESKVPPLHLLRGERLFGAAEEHLLEAGEALTREVESLTEQRDELEVILRDMSEGVVVADAHGRVILVNRAAREMLGLGRELDYRGRGLVEICREPALQQLIQRSLADSATETIEVSIGQPAIRHLRVTAGAVGTPARTGARHVLLFYDITRLRAYENLRSDFIANLTHEIRTPLTAVCGYAEALLSGGEDEETRHRFLAIIERQAGRMARLVEDLVSLSDLERGLIPLSLSALDVHRLLGEAVELMQEQAERQGVALTVECPSDLPPLVGDRDRLYQVLLNLLDNAIKYTPAGGKVTAGARIVPARKEGTGAIELVVSDTGEGIPPQHIPRLTERFYRVDQARSRELGGTGLGLAIVKHIAQRHHGEVFIESKIREGTTVIVRLPQAKLPDSGTESVPNGASGAA